MKIIGILLVWVSGIFIGMVIKAKAPPFIDVVTITQVCLNEKYTLGIGTNTKTIGLEVFRGRLCLNCHGIHNPLLLSD